MCKCVFCVLFYSFVHCCGSIVVRVVVSIWLFFVVFSCFLLFSGLERVSMGLENFFQRESSTFLLAFSVLLLFLYGVLGSIFAGLACA